MSNSGKPRVRAAASRVGDAPTERALKRVRFAADRVEDDAETPEATSVSAPSSLPAEAVTTNSLPAHSSEPALPASAGEVADQVMSEGTSSAPDAAVRLSMKRSSELITPRAMLSCFWTILTSVTQSSRVGKFCRRQGTFLVDVNDWDTKSRDNLRACCSDGTTVACSSGGATKELM